LLILNNSFSTGAKNFEISANHVFGSDVCNCLQNIELEIDGKART